MFDICGTLNYVKAKLAKKIGMREFLRNTKKIKAAVARGEEFEVCDRTTPVFRIVPAVTTHGKKYTFDDLMKLKFHSGQNNLSQSVDDIVYGN